MSYFYVIQEQINGEWEDCYDVITKGAAIVDCKKVNGRAIKRCEFCCEDLEDLGSICTCPESLDELEEIGRDRRAEEKTEDKRL